MSEISPFVAKDASSPGLAPHNLWTAVAEPNPYFAAQLTPGAG